MRMKDINKLIPKLKQLACPVCGTKFMQKRRDQVYDSNVCNQKAYHHRLRKKLARLEELEKKGAA
jgi:DNA-directed RNA polymerase subunit RPC12/RpoP